MIRDSRFTQIELRILPHPFSEYKSHVSKRFVIIHIISNHLNIDRTLSLFPVPYIPHAQDIVRCDA